MVVGSIKCTLHPKCTLCCHHYQHQQQQQLMYSGADINGEREGIHLVYAPRGGHTRPENICLCRVTPLSLLFFFLSEKCARQSSSLSFKHISHTYTAHTRYFYRWWYILLKAILLLFSSPSNDFYCFDVFVFLGFPPASPLI